MDKLPTTPGSVVSFVVQPEDYLTDPQPYDEPQTSVATLIPGSISSTGEIQSAVWASAYIDDPEDQGNVYSEEFILARDPQLLVETFPASERPDLVEMVNESGIAAVGAVIHVNQYEGEPESTFVFAPGFIHDGELGDCMFTNSYGGFHVSDVFESDPILLYVPDKLI
jgi:hypothetical protein